MKIRRRFSGLAHLALVVGIGVLCSVVTWGVALGIAARTPPVLRPLDFILLAVVGCAVVASCWDKTWRYPAAGLYAFGLIALGAGQIHRAFAPGRFFIWGNASDLAFFLLLTALGGWLLPQFKPFAARLRIPDDGERWSIMWFVVAQVLLASVIASQAMWISLDFSFDGVGEGKALFGLSGRLVASPIALMLVGAAILMAWQTEGTWHAFWQYAAFAFGLLFTGSLGWSQIEAPATLDSAEMLWLQRNTALLLSASMMTLMTRFGLARILPRQSDWIPRARHASFVFGSLALLLLAAVLIQTAIATPTP